MKFLNNLFTGSLITWTDPAQIWTELKAQIAMSKMFGIELKIFIAPCHCCFPAFGCGHIWPQQRCAEVGCVLKQNTWHQDRCQRLRQTRQDKTQNHVGCNLWFSHFFYFAQKPYRLKHNSFWQFEKVWPCNCFQFKFQLGSPQNKDKRWYRTVPRVLLLNDLCTTLWKHGPVGPNSCIDFETSLLLQTPTVLNNCQIIRLHQNNPHTLGC